MDNIVTKVKRIKKGTIIDFKANANIITRLYDVLSYISKSLTKEQIETYSQEVSSLLEITKGEKEFSQDWMIHVTTITILIQQLEDAADKQGLTYEENGETLLNELKTNLEAIIGDDNLSPDQSQ